MWLKAVEQPKLKAYKITCYLKRESIQLHIPHIRMPNYLKWLYYNLVTLGQCPCKRTKRKKIPWGPQFVRYVNINNKQDQELITCKLLEPLDLVKASSDTCARLKHGSTTSERCGWGCTWSWALKPSWRDCIVANIGGGDGCWMMFTIFITIKYPLTSSISNNIG